MTGFRRGSGSKKKKSFRLIAAAMLGAALFSVTLLTAFTAHADGEDGLIYGTEAADYSEDREGAVSIDNPGQIRTPVQNDSPEGSGSGSLSGGITIGDTNRPASGAGSPGGSSGSYGEIVTGGGTGNGAADTEYLGNLLYGRQVSDLFDSKETFLTIDGRKNTTTVSSAGSGFKLVYNSLSIYVYLRAQGFSSASACGVLGNIMQDSAFDPTAVNKDNGAYGLYQCAGEQKDELQSLCTDITDPMQQTAAVIEKLAPALFEENGPEVNSMTYEKFKALTDPGTAAEAWRAVVKQNTYTAADTSRRQMYAQNYYEQWKDYDGAGFDIIQEAVKYLGGKYVLGGNSLTDGIDCSHYVCQILTITGHYSGEYRYSGDLRSIGTEVADLADAEPGDVLCWNGHVAMYIADGYYIHAASARSGICIGNGNIETMLGGLITIRRVR